MRTLLLLLIATWSLPAFAQDHLRPPTSHDHPADVGLYDMRPQVVVKGDRVVGTKPDGKIAWAIQHLSADRDARTGEVEFPIVGPVEFGGDTMYAIRGDLLTLDTEAGRIVARQQYPALISDLSIEGDQLMVELDIRHNDFGDTTKVRTPYKAGFVPGRGPWESFVFVMLRAATDVPSSLRDDEKFAERKSKWTPERKMLLMAEQRDPTNPMLPAYRGLAAQADGDEDAANTAFAKAIVAAGLWNEKLQLCGILERAHRPGLAESTCEAGKEGMIAAGVRPEAMLNLIGYVVMMKNLRLAMKDAVEREDLDAVHRIANYTYEIFPNVEAGFMAYHSLGEWFAAHNDPRATEWATRARQAESSPITRAMWGRARSVDFWLLLVTALFFAFPIAGFALGLRRPRDDRERRWDWLPRPTVLDGVVLAALLVAIFPASMQMRSEVAAIGYYAEAPIAVTQEGFGSPDVIDWLEQMPPSPARDEVLAYGRHELEAVKAGKRVTMAPPDPLTPLTAVEEIAAIEGRDQALSLDLMTDSVGDVSVPNAVPFTFPGALLFFVFAVFGRLTRRKAPEVADTLSLGVPGAYAGFLAPLLITALLAGALYLFTPVGTVLQSIATPAFGKYFGLGEIDAGASFAPPADTVLAWAALLGALAVHAVTVVIARRRAD